MIPKIIHYCWFGNSEMPKISKQCIASWKKVLPEYEIKFWNENNFDVNVSVFSKQAYQHNKFAFVSDYARVYILKKEGGIYLDIDIEVVKNLDEILKKNVVLGTDENGFLTAFMAAKKESKYFSELLEVYDKMEFIKKNGTTNNVTNNHWMQEVLIKFGFELINKNQELLDGVFVYQDDFFHARSLVSGKYNITNNTYAIHHHSLSWISFKTKIIRFFRLKLLVPIIGSENYTNFTKKLK
jgi:mannosyltransferase OCH1-like enzyme